MSDERDLPSALSAEDEAIAAVAGMHLDHHRNTTRTQTAIDKLTAYLGQPVFLLLLSTAILIWIGGNFMMVSNGLQPLDAPPFEWLHLAATLGALFVTFTILATQRRADTLADRRARLVLELALMSDKKTAKLVSLLEELRRDHPDLKDRIDPESESLSRPSDPETVLAEIDQKSGDNPAA